MAEIPTTIDTDRIVTGKTDDRGRLSLGTEYSGEEVEVAILEREGDGDE